MVIGFAMHPFGFLPYFDSNILLFLFAIVMSLHKLHYCIRLLHKLNGHIEGPSLKDDVRFGNLWPTGWSFATMPANSADVKSEAE